MLNLTNISISKSKRFNVRVNKFQYHKVIRKAQQMKVKPSQYIRRLIDNDNLRPDDYKDLAKYYELKRKKKQDSDNYSYDIKEIGNNINQIARGINTQIKMGFRIDNQYVILVSQRLSEIQRQIEGA